MTTRLYISNLADATLKQDLEILFRNFSKIVSAKLIRDKITHKPNGSAFISMGNYQDACRAVQALDGIKFLGNFIEVILASVRRKPLFSIHYWS